MLLDTHAFLWFVMGDARLSATARGLTEDAKNERLVSAGSLWKIAVKVSIGKLTLTEPFEVIIPRELSQNGFQILPITVAHLTVLCSLPFHHRDPFDRLLVAQAMADTMPLVSIDPEHSFGHCQRATEMLSLICRIRQVGRTLSFMWIALALAFGTSCAERNERDAAGPVDKRIDYGGHQILGPGFGAFIFVAGGEFTMGRNNGENDDERPEHRVKLSSFFVQRTPVTCGQFVRFLNEARINPSEYLCSQARWAKSGIRLADGKWVCSQGAEAEAACGESWILAERYCEWLSRKSGRKCRLPTEAEWEYVCRGKEGRKFPWGDNEYDLDNKIWRWRYRIGANKVPVGSFPKGAAPEGICDLIGYMDEMCSDWYDPGYYAKSPTNNPRGPIEPISVKEFRNAKVVRGGLERRYRSKGLVGFLRESKFFNILPSIYLPRGWSRDAAVPPSEPRFVYGRLGFRVVVEEHPSVKTCRNR